MLLFIGSLLHDEDDDDATSEMEYFYVEIKNINPTKLKTAYIPTASLAIFGASNVGINADATDPAKLLYGASADNCIIPKQL